MMWRLLVVQCLLLIQVVRGQEVRKWYLTILELALMFNMTLVEPDGDGEMLQDKFQKCCVEEKLYSPIDK
jgi:hypothetical protein